MGTTLFGLSLLALCPEPAPSRVYYVDQDADTCPGDGSDATPFCSLSEVETAALAPGDAIRIRDAASPYEAWSVDGLASGTADAPIVIEPDCGHQPVIEGRLILNDVSHWTVRQLNIEGGTGNAVTTLALTTDVEGVRIADNVITSRDGIGISVDAELSLVNRGAVVSGNVVENTKGVGIRVRGSQGASIEHNHVTGLRCGDPGEFAPSQAGISVDRTLNTVLAHNAITDFVDDCEEEMFRRAGIRIRQESATGTIERNLIQTIPTGTGAEFVGGIWIHEDSEGWTVRRNVVLDVGGCGLCDGVLGAGIGTQWINNTVYATDDPAIRVQNATLTEVHNNLLIADGAPVVRVDEAASISAWDGNLYAGPLEGSAFVLAGNSLDFAAWRDGCACDGRSVDGDPLLAGGDLTPSAQSPAIDLGTPQGEPFTAAAPDAGAFEAPAPTTARLDPSDPTRFAIAFGSIPFGPLQPSSDCGGLSVQLDAEIVRPTSCELVEASDGDTQLWLSIADPPTSSVAIIRYGDGPLVDSLGVGGRLSARAQAFELEVELDAPPGSSSSGGADSTETAGAFPDPDLGCACKATQRRSIPWFAVVLAASVCRRRRLRALTRGSHATHDGC